MNSLYALIIFIWGTFIVCILYFEVLLKIKNIWKWIIR